MPYNWTTGSNNLIGETSAYQGPAGTNPDFRLVSGAAPVNGGTASGAPTQDSGFDPKCITPKSGQAVSWWQ